MPDRQDVTRELSDFVARSEWPKIPPAVRHEVRRSLVNIVGCMLGGARHDVIDLTDRSLSEFAGPPVATLFGRARKADVLHAGLINSLSSSIYAFDDTHEQAVVHPSGTVAAALFALAERASLSGPAPMSGTNFLHAFTLGVELVCRLSKSISVPPARGDIAWAQTGVSAGYGTAQACGHALKLGTDQLSHAAGIALSQAAGFRAMFGTMTSSLMNAHAGQCGLRAAILAGSGFTSSSEALEGRHGFLSLFTKKADIGALTGSLGTEFEILRNTYKPYPCGIVIHPMIEACLKLRSAHKLDPSGIASVTVKAAQASLTLTDRRDPKDPMQARVSLYHWIAVALLRGTARLDDMTPASVLDAAVVTFQQKVKTAADESLASDSAIVIVTTADGRVLMERVEHCAGSATNPMSDRDLDAKFLGQAEPVVGAARANALLQHCWEIEGLADAGMLAKAAG